MELKGVNGANRYDYLAVKMWRFDLVEDRYRFSVSSHYLYSTKT